MKNKNTKSALGLLLLLVLVFTSCTVSGPSQDDIVKRNTEEYLLPLMNDPESYEFVKMELIDSVRYIDNINYRKKMFKDSKEELAAIDSLELSMGTRKNDIASYTYLFSFRGNNAMGAKILSDYYVQTGPKESLEIINMTKDEGKVLVTPGSFPGYFETIKKFY